MIDVSTRLIHIRTYSLKRCPFADANGCPMLPAEMTPSHVKYLMDEDDTQFDVVIDVRSKLEFDGIGGEGADDIARNKIGRMPGRSARMMSLPAPDTGT
eukprot:3941534-Rhodomonas_salina.3